MHAQSSCSGRAAAVSSKIITARADFRDPRNQQRCILTSHRLRPSHEQRKRKQRVEPGVTDISADLARPQRPGW